MNGINMASVLIVILGGLFGWSLGKLPDTWVYVLVGGAILLVTIVIKTQG